MDSTLERHGGKHACRVPVGLRELCADISREVLRSQPDDVYAFVADYVAALLLTRENAKVAVKVVDNVVTGSEAVMSVLIRSGLSIEQIARAAPRLQKVFRDYLDAVDARRAVDDDISDVRSRLSVRNVLESSGATLEQAERAATIIQAAFRDHYEKMRRDESRGLVRWSRAASNTMEILRRAGTSRDEAARAVTLIQAAYRGYYERRNARLRTRPETEGAFDRELKDEKDDGASRRAQDPGDAIRTVAWLDATYEKSGLSFERVHEAASVIQNAYRTFRARSRSRDEERRIFEPVVSREDVGEDYESREDMAETGEKLRRDCEERVSLSRLSREARVSSEEDEAFEIEWMTTGSFLEAEDARKHHPSEEDLEEQRMYSGAE